MSDFNKHKNSSPQKYITVIGSSNTDMVVRTPHIPRPGETVMGGDFIMCPGGKGANQAVTVARLGGQVYFVAKLGKDIFGQESKKAFEKDGVHVDYVSFHEKQASGVALIKVDNNGENSIVVAPGANSFLGAEDVARATDCIIDSEILLIQLEIPLATVIEVAALANKHHKKLILNPAPACHLPDSILNGLYLITPNNTEVEILTGIKVSGEADCLAAANQLKKRGVKNVIITLGEEGAYVNTDEFTGMIRAEKVKVVDTTGAGDIFNGSLALSLSQGAGMEDAVRFANQVAGISVTRIGAQTSIPSKYELSLLTI